MTDAMTDGVDEPPKHDEDRARREFRLLTADEAREQAGERLARWRRDNPGIEPTPRQRGRA